MGSHCHSLTRRVYRVVSREEGGTRQTRLVVFPLHLGCFAESDGLSRQAGQAGMRSPSERLSQILTQTGLCSRTELEHCEPIVRRLSHDLPDFDSVWLDALVQQRYLTPWQAERLQTNEADQIVVGRFQKQLPLGRATFQATETNHLARVVLRQLQTSDQSARPAIARGVAELMASIERVRTTAPAGLVLPEEHNRSRIAPDAETEVPPATDEPGDLFLVSTYIPGWTMEELLIRGGRLPFAAVAEIGRELLTALAWLESSRLLHGDLVTRNVRLDARGGIHLVDPFARRLQQPRFALTDRLTLRDCDGIAPEQVGTGRAADARSELYSLGCLLWQLLTSRPVVLSADPVTRLMKQKEQDIVDVRGRVPDCPEWMSRLIQSMTRRSPELRPASAAELLKQWKASASAGQHHCRVLARQMPDHAVRSRPRPFVRRARNGRSWLWPTTATVVLGLLVFLTARTGVLPKTLRLSTWSDLKNVFATEGNGQVVQPANIVPAQQAPLPLPGVDSDGLIRLDSGKSYVAADREFAGILRILCEQSPTASVLVSEGATWILQARALELRGVSLSMRDDRANAEAQAASRRPQQLLAVLSAALTISDCVIQSPSSADNFAGVAWQRPVGEEGTVIIANTVFAGGGYSISLNNPPRRCEFDNVLFANRAGGIQCEFSKGDSEAWDVSCRNVTQRFGFSLIDGVIHPNGISQLRLSLTSAECVYDPQMAIVRLGAPATWKPEAMQVQFRAGETGNPAVVPPATQHVVYVDKALGQMVSLPDLQITENTLLLADLTFRASSTDTADTVGSEWSASTLDDFEGPKLTEIMPGIDVSRLPGIHDDER